MKRATLTLIVPWFLFLAASLFAPPASVSANSVPACNCGTGSVAVEEAVKLSFMVFRGKVLAEKVELVNGMKYHTALFLVQESWKGADVTQVIVRMPDGACPFEWVPMEEYVIYGLGDADGGFVSSCMRSAPVGQAAADLARLGPGTPPERVVDLQHEFDENRTVYLIGFFASLAVVIGSAAVMVRRYRRYRQFR